MSTVTVTIPDMQVQLSVEQLITAVRQLAPPERAKLVQALIDTELDSELNQLINELYNQPPHDDISDEEILAEIQAVRRQQ
ncbi:MAG: hypothetical protein KDD89_02810 [Anaerolineales bacterium]|nr:hypothetical protein [Anaerolineales bacterium]